MRKYKQKELRDLVRLGVAEDYTSKPSECAYILNRLEKSRLQYGDLWYKWRPCTGSGNGHIVRHYWPLHKLVYCILIRNDMCRGNGYRVIRYNMHICMERGK